MVATAIWKFCSASCRRSRACSSDPRTSKSSSKVKHPRCTSSGWSRQRCARWGLWTSATASAPQARRLPCHRRGRRSKSRLACWLRARRRPSPASARRRRQVQRCQLADLARRPTDPSSGIIPLTAFTSWTAGVLRDFFPVTIGIFSRIRQFGGNNRFFSLRTGSRRQRLP